ncbi:hypothetical protein [Streptomyces lasiicapitis]|nr:hypothetical protein [Streptomyces lasiicapitis]
MRGKTRLGVVAAVAVVALTGGVAPVAAVSLAAEPVVTAPVTVAAADGPAVSSPTPGPPEATATPSPASTQAPAGRMADTGAGIVPWIVAGAAGALGVGAVAFATTRRRQD